MDEEFAEKVRGIILARRSIRKYQPKEVDFDIIGKLCEAGLAAPSAGNIQDAKAVIIFKESSRNAIAKACFEQMWMAGAPVHLVVCCDVEKSQRMYGIRGERLYSIQNCAAYIENVIIAANAYGLGACWVGAFNEEELKAIVGIPDNIRPQGIITIGYPAEEKAPPPKYQLMEMTFLNRWGAKTWNARKEVFKEYSPFVENGIENSKNFLDKVSDKIKDTVKKYKR